MRADVAIGLTVHADLEFLRLAERLLGELDYLEVTPETLWRWDEHGELHPNDYHPYVLDMGRAAGLAFVGHGVGLSLGALADEGRHARWHDRIRADHAAFHFEWYTDHLGATTLGGWHLTLPCPLPMTAPHARLVRRRLAALRAIVGEAGVENTANHFCLGAPLDEPAFLAAATDGPGLHLLLDLDNLHAMAGNLGFDPRAYLARLPLDRVIEIHLAGGGVSNSAWLPSGRRLLLDGHDRRVPEAVWELFDEALPYCPNLRGVTLERMSDTVGAADVGVLRAELRRVRHALGRTGRSAPPARLRPTEPPSACWTVAHERAYARALCRHDPATALRASTRDWAPWLRAAFAAADEDGLRMTSLLVAKLRFERILHGSTAAARCFRESPLALAAAFRAYHRACPPRDHAPWREARRFQAWCRQTATGAEPALSTTT